jgi:hypothetical protein
MKKLRKKCLPDDDLLRSKNVAKVSFVKNDNVASCDGLGETSE